MCSTVDGVSVITKCARLSISSSIMLAHQASNQARRRRIGQGSEHSTVSFLMGTEKRYVPKYPRTQSPPAHLIPHLALGSSTTRPDRRRAHSQEHVRTWGCWGGRYEGTWSLHPHGRPGWLRHRHVSCSSPTGTWEVFLSRSWPRQITAVQGSCGYSGTNARGTSGPRTWVAPAHPLLMPSLLPPLLPTCDRAWQAMAEGTDRQAYSPATRLLAFVLSKWAILEWSATARTPRT